jgi:hypothetical protein
MPQRQIEKKKRSCGRNTGDTLNPFGKEFGFVSLMNIAKEDDLFKRVCSHLNAWNHFLIETARLHDTKKFVRQLARKHWLSLLDTNPKASTTLKNRYKWAIITLNRKHNDS